MEVIPVSVLIGLFCAISLKLPRFEEWDTSTHVYRLYNQTNELHDTLTEMRAHVIKHGELANFCGTAFADSL